MATIHVRDVSDSAVTTLKVRAARAVPVSPGLCAPAVVESEAIAVTPEAGGPSVRVNIAARSEVTADDVVDVVTAMREARA